MCLINALRNKSTLLQVASMLSHIVPKSLALSECTWSFVKREGNMVAHSIATWTIGCNDEIVLEGTVPDCASVWVAKSVLTPTKSMIRILKDQIDNAE